MSLRKKTGLALLAASASASRFLTLSNFEPLASLSLPLNCVFAYNTPLRGCGLDDFLSSKGGCSPECKLGLQAVQAGIAASCAGVGVLPRTLLWDAQEGRLLDSLCVEEETTSATEMTTASSMPAAPTEVRENSVSSVTVVPLMEPPAVQRNDSTETNSSLSTATTATMTGEEEEPPRRTLQPGSGGGSPFDFVTSGSCGRQAGEIHVGVAFVALYLLDSHIGLLSSFLR